MFPQLPDRLNYREMEASILAFWRDANIFERSIETRPEDRIWTFYEGPPTVNGVPGIHHVLSRGLKDVFCRYKTMRGYRVHRKAGWDTHGLPVEIALEKQLGLREKGEIETKIGVANFNRMAKDLVYHHINQPGGWRELTERIGYWVNLDDPYITCTFDNDETGHGVPYAFAAQTVRSRTFCRTLPFDLCCTRSTCAVCNHRRVAGDGGDIPIIVQRYPAG